MWRRGLLRETCGAIRGSYIWRFFGYRSSWVYAFRGASMQIRSRQEFPFSNSFSLFLLLDFVLFAVRLFLCKLLYFHSPRTVVKTLFSCLHRALVQKSYLFTQMYTALPLYIPQKQSPPYRILWYTAVDVNVLAWCTAYRIYIYIYRIYIYIILQVCRTRVTVCTHTGNKGL